MTALYWICAAVGFAVALVGIVLDGVLDVVDLDLGPDWLSLPALGAGVGAFGVTGLSVGAATDSSIVALVAAGVVGVLFLAGTAWLTVLLMRAPTDATPDEGSAVGSHGRVVTPVVAGGRGEVLLEVAGQTRKLSATADEDLAVGTAVVAVAPVSDTTVVVMSQQKFWGSDSPEEGRNP